MVANNVQGFPQISAPLVQQGALTVTPAWFQFFLTLWNRTGGAQPNPGTIPSGIMSPFGGPTPPSGWLSCDGTAVNRSTYASLYAAIGVTWGDGDGSTTFNLPNMINKLPIAAGGVYALAATGGDATATLSVSNLPAHNHGVTDPGHTHTVTDPTHTHTVTDPGHTHTVTDPGHHHTATTTASDVTVGAGVGGATSGNTGSATTGITNATNTTGITNVDASTGVTNQDATTGITTNNTGSGASFSILPPYVGLNYIIKT